MQRGLFDAELDIDYERDPYESVRAAGHRLATEFVIGDREAFDLVLGYGSEDAARRALVQRWWRGEVQPRAAA